MRRLFRVFLFLFCAALVGLGTLAVLIYTVGKDDYKYNGDQVFSAVNQYRLSQNLKALELDPVLCDNLVERYYAIRQPQNGHKGFEEWVKTEQIKERGNFGGIGELFVTRESTPQNAIAWWLGSPGHKATLEMNTINVGCAYANDGTAVVVVAEKK